MSRFPLFLAVLLVSSAFCALKPKVTTPYGPIVGFEHTSTVTGGKYHVFLGVRYGNPPDHIYRFQKPEPVEKWPHINHDATHFRASCIPSLRSELEEHVNYSEDCLFLNIVTPPDAREKKLPVLVFIHGGGFQFGDSSMVGYEKAADNFVSKDIIFVSVQYRLGPLGFFTTGDSEIPGNMGLWDQTLALQFLHEVLPDFGGDVDRITLAGHSAGAASVSALLYSPHSDHLFSQAIQLSGSIFAENNLNQNVIEDSRELAKAAGCTQEDSKELRDCIEIRTVDELLDAMEKVGELLPGPRNKKFHPYFDKDFFPYDIEKMSRKAPKKRTMQGLVSLESGISVLYPVKLAKLLGVPKESWATYSKINLKDFIQDQVAVEREFGTASSRFASLVEEFYLNGPMTGNSSFYLNAYALLLSDLQYNIPTLHEIELKLQHGWETFFYVIDYDSETTRDPTHPIRGPFHASELRFLFNFNDQDKIPFNDRDEKFEDNFVNSIVSFIKSGNPTTEAVPWSSVSKNHPFANLLLNDKPKMQSSFRPEAYELWQSDIAKTVGADLMKKRLPAEMIYNLLISLIFAISLFPNFLESCNCKDFMTEKDGYCATAWISKVNVLSKETDGLGLMMSYRLEHLKVIKAPENVTLPEIMNTATQESACGQTHFKVGKQYIFGGSSANNASLLITFCDWRVPLKYINEPKLEMKPEWKKFVESVGKCPQPGTSS